MQATQLEQILGKQAAVLRAAGANSVCDLIERLATAIGRGEQQSAAKFLAAVEKAGTSSGTAEASLLGAAVDTLKGFVDLFAEAGVKKTVVADVQLILDLTRRHSEVSVSEFESTIERVVASASRGKGKNGATPVEAQELVDSYLQRLEAALGNEGMFRIVYRELSADKRADREAVIEIASRFFETTPASTSRPKALQKVLCRHEKLMESRRASSSIGGRAA